MLSRDTCEPALFQMVGMGSLVPSDHVLRKIDAVLDLSSVPDAVAACCSANRGRPSIDPELAVRMMSPGALYDLSDRELCTEIRMHAGMRWFCGQNFHDPVPDHSTLSRLRNERFRGALGGEDCCRGGERPPNLARRHRTSRVGWNIHKQTVQLILVGHDLLVAIARGRIRASQFHPVQRARSRQGIRPVPHPCPLFARQVAAPTVPAPACCPFESRHGR